MQQTAHLIVMAVAMEQDDVILHEILFLQWGEGNHEFFISLFTILFSRKCTLSVPPQTAHSSHRGELGKHEQTGTLIELADHAYLHHRDRCVLLETQRLSHCA